MPNRKITQLKTHAELLSDEVAGDEEFRAEWQRLALAREVAAQLIGYRADHGLSQRALAELLGVTQPRVAKLESGEHNPSIDTLIAITHATGIEFVLDIAPANRKPKLVTKGAQERRAVSHNDVAVLAAAR